VGGALLLQGLLMVSPALWRTPVQVWGSDRARKATGFDRGQRRLLIDNWGVSVAVALNTVALGLAAAVLIGATFAVLLFVRANMRDVVRRVRNGENTRSLKMRPPALAEALRREGRRIAVLELEGALFFGTADALRSQLDGLVETVDTAILDLHQVAEIDATGARILLETGEDWMRRGKHLVAAEWSPNDPRRRSLEVMANPGSQPGLSFAADTDTALEQAEERLLDRLNLQAEPGHLLALGDTLLGRGLGSADLAALAAEMSTVHIPAQAVLFRVNDPGDGLYVSVSGHIGLRLPGGTRRLASFAPGVVLGEMSVLSGLPRSAQAVAETELTVLRLSVESFERLKRERPALAALVLHNIALHLADRVRALTIELSGWVARSSVARAEAAAAAPPPLEFDDPHDNSDITDEG
jgi:SulP family sulfate permease